jgi:hypothetical protein
MAYLTGELLNYDPWTRIQGQARCTSFRCVSMLMGSDTVRDVDCGPKRQINDGRNKIPSMVNDVSWVVYAKHSTDQVDKVNYAANRFQKL